MSVDDVAGDPRPDSRALKNEAGQDHPAGPSTRWMWFASSADRIIVLHNGAGSSPMASLPR